MLQKIQKDSVRVVGATSVQMLIVVHLQMNKGMLGMHAPFIAHPSVSKTSHDPQGGAHCDRDQPLGFEISTYK